MGTQKELDACPLTMTTEDVAELLGHPVKLIQIMCRDGRLPAHRDPGAH